MSGVTGCRRSASDARLSVCAAPSSPVHRVHEFVRACVRECIGTCAYALARGCGGVCVRGCGGVCGDVAVCVGMWGCVRGCGGVCVGGGGGTHQRRVDRGSGPADGTAADTICFGNILRRTRCILAAQHERRHASDTVATGNRKYRQSGYI